MSEQTREKPRPLRGQTTRELHRMVRGRDPHAARAAQYELDHRPRNALEREEAHYAPNGQPIRWP